MDGDGDDVVVGNKMLLAPQPLTMDRLEQRNELIVAQSTSQCCRKGCCQPSINWLIAEGNNYEPGTNPFALDSVGWIHEESDFLGRCCSGCGAGYRRIKYVQHVGPTPSSLMNENTQWCTCQCDEYPTDLSELDRTSNIVLVHEKNSSCGVYCCWIPCVCDCCGTLPYLETKDPLEDNRVLGRTQYVCDACFFVPKYDILDGTGTIKYRLRPDTCILGLCVQCRCDGKKGKCFRVPFYLRDPHTQQHLPSDATVAGGRTLAAMIDVLWTGWINACCSAKNAYHVTFPTNISSDEKAVLIGSTLLVDVTVFEQQDNNDN
mmetsp:Transcript_24035/g.24308  ORF Transcript_24035/g.24308 Transcript_24035/m.24308 type:complete len:318 (+) Transcript_24035:33-986(+)